MHFKKFIFRKKFKTRSGDTVKLLDLLDEGVRRAEEKLRSRETVSFFSDSIVGTSNEFIESRIILMSVHIVGGVGLRFLLAV